MAQVKCPKCDWEGEVPDADTNGFVECGACEFSFLPYTPREPGTPGVAHPRPARFYAGLAICAWVIMIASALSALGIGSSDDDPTVLLYAGGVLISGLFTGFVGLAIRDIAIHSRDTRDATYRLARRDATEAVARAMAKQFGKHAPSKDEG